VIIRRYSVEEPDAELKGVLLVRQEEESRRDGSHGLAVT
jgi:hypothetical protein